MESPTGEAADPQRFERHLSTLDVTALGVGAIIGGGIFASLGTAALGSAATPGAGPSLMLSTALTALCCGLTALCYSELATLFPTAGSAYAYSRQAFGRRAGFLMGWCLTLEYAIANVAVALSWGEYASDLLRSAGVRVPCSPALLGAGVVLLLTLLLSRGQRASASLNNAMVSFKVAVLLLFVGLGLWFLPPATLLQNWQPFFAGGARGTLYGAAVIFFSFI
ncbi:MAG: amino acid permease, partial [Deltaproteobacteria bacterium]